MANMHLFDHVESGKIRDAKREVLTYFHSKVHLIGWLELDSSLGLHFRLFSALLASERTPHKWGEILFFFFLTKYSYSFKIYRAKFNIDM